MHERTEKSVLVVAFDDFDKQRLEKIYMETDQLAQDILEYFEDSYDTIIFMSDHGSPTEDQHNNQGFYSSNRELFGSKQPHITDFYGKILQLQRKRQIKQ